MKTETSQYLDAKREALLEHSPQAMAGAMIVILFAVQHTISEKGMNELKAELNVGRKHLGPMYAPLFEFIDECWEIHVESERLAQQEI